MHTALLIGDWVHKIGEVVDLPHPKRELRRAAYASIIAGDTGAISLGSTFTSRRTAGSGKVYEVRQNMKMETANPAKVPRVTSDLGVANSIRAGWLPEAVKKSTYSQPFVTPSYELRYVKSPSITELSEIFQTMIMGSKNMCIYFSDDMCVVVRCSDGVLFFNLDISGCDASNTDVVFNALYDYCSPDTRQHMSALIGQCERKCVVGYGKGKLLFKPEGPFEYSGTVLTTVLNNVSSSAIGNHVLRDLPLDTRTVTEGRVRSRISELGWKVTVERCEFPEDLQFLKCSPVLSQDGLWIATLNLGVIFRAFGKTRRDYPGQGDIGKRIHSFNRGVVGGLRFAGNHSLTRLLRARWPLGVKPIELGYTWADLAVSYSDTQLDEDSLCRRYNKGSTRMQPSDLSDMLAQFTHAQTGDLLRHPFIDSVMEKDYGLQPPTRWGGPTLTRHLGNHEFNSEEIVQKDHRQEVLIKSHTSITANTIHRS